MKNNIIISAIIGVISALFMMYIAWKHNPQYEIHEKEVIDFGYWITIGISWFLLAFVVVFVLMKIVKYIYFHFIYT